MRMFVARQPIFDRQKKVFAYELLFRSGFLNFFTERDFDHASSKVIADSALQFGLSSLTGSRRAFINVSRDVLLRDLASVLPPEEVVIELLETIDIDEDVLAACRQLKKAHYWLALDDFVDRAEMAPLVDLADILKIDFRATPAEQRKALAKKYGSARVSLLAEKVETLEELGQGLDLGYQYFQGYFFSKPVIVTGKAIPSIKINYLRLLREINRPDVDFAELERIIKQDVSIVYQLLRYINSAAFGLRREIKSIMDALVLLGEYEIRKLASLWALARLGEDKPAELVVTSIVRGRYCEHLAAPAGMHAQKLDLFLMGMFSLIDVITDRAMQEALQHVYVSDEARMALLGESNRHRRVLDTILAYEKGEWRSVAEHAAALGIEEDLIAAEYVSAIEWSTQAYPGN